LQTQVAVKAEPGGQLHGKIITSGKAK
jgi:hypothetical protein